MVAAGYVPIVVNQKLTEGGALEPDLAAITAAMESVPREELLCVFLTTSCFAPRSPDDVPGVAKECMRLGIPLVVNNAYGLQCSKCCQLIDSGCREGRVDAVVQSTDKNFQVPVGGAILFGRLADKVSRLYPGRASMAPILDLFVTFLESGREGIISMFKTRRELFTWFNPVLEERLVGMGLSLIKVPGNRISFAIDLSGVDGKGKELSVIGSQLFFRRVSGPRVVTCEDVRTVIDGIDFINFGAHHPNYRKNYLTVALAVGVEKEEMLSFLDRLGRILA